MTCWQLSYFVVFTAVLLGVMSMVSFSVAGVQALLEVVNDLFEEQTDLEKIVRKIMHRAQTLLKCERCSVQLLEDIESPVRFPPVSLYICVWQKHTKALINYSFN